MRVVVEAELQLTQSFLEATAKKNKKKTNIVLGHQMNTTQLKLPNTGQLGSVHWFETLPGCLICTQIKGKCDK